uniref:Transposase IS4-like domain-containing protein n=1 Tax=Kuenenia stuttgartiensis TaxID=174633 RepID=Q1PXV1_KUEST|nr:hypothetical protein kusta0007 [Candidatus Kuenenia stuttgartiensis]CAJ72488.1 hypothetical protein kustd1743 [Candidatus Kuenenia stuttgartiensis]CAJ72868.1 hypothetical protein kustd2123 [Candidatus Kuenenia stuttgartiensis]CAJ72978.1 hypothetical protein kustd2233 [Candidatus Kuenenia stuttgartiensis]CAJ74071.1 hypothetical protein kuste3311 [Candidatus Kuenenia stuttgartiensis]
MTQEHVKSLDEDNLDRIARETCFVQRSTNKVSGRDFVELLSAGHFDSGIISLEGLSDVLREKSPESDITPQALSKKINSDKAVSFLERTFEAIYKEQVCPKLEKIPFVALEQFSNVYLQDSTQIALNEHLAEEFKGTGGSASKSSVKIDLLYEAVHHILKEVSITKGTYPDQKNGAKVLKHIGERDLLLRDLGYFDLSVLGDIEGKGAYYLSRFFKSTKVYLSADPGAEAIDLVSYVKKHIGNKGLADMEVYLGEERICSRLIAYRAPGHVINERRRKAKRAVQKSGKTLSREYLEWLDYSFYITNVGAEIWSPEVVGTIYRIRWQIELVFKQWKQLFRMDVMRGTREERIRCLLYGRLIMICIVTRIYALSAWYCHSTMCREVSGVKLIQWLQRKGRLSRAIADNMLPALMEELLKSFPKGLLKQKRRRKTTLELISGQVGFLEGFSL